MSKRSLEIVERRRVYDGFFNLDVLRLRHSLFRGGMSPVMSRELFLQRRAVAVLPFDPRRDVVVLIEQFRVGALDEGDSPWMLEGVAGLVEGDDTAEATAAREVEEECGLKLGRLEAVGIYASSPGATTERVHVFIGEVAAPENGGVYGMEHENEDILVHTVPYAEMLAMRAAGRIIAVNTVVPLQHLMLHRERLRREWG